MEPRKIPHIPGLDGLRAIAVAAVVLYHAGVAWLPGGYLGVEVFFVVSGYLITSILLAERAQSGRIDLKRFWLARARRLLPALFAMLAVTLAYSVAFLPGELARLRGDALAAAGYSTNWRLVLTDVSYFESFGRPSALQHLWSLAVEEQFYLAWPLAFAFLARKLPLRALALITIVGAAGSSVLMALLFEPGADPSRVYYGTDTRAGGILLGAALAITWRPWERRDTEPGLARGFALDVAGVMLLAAIVMLFLRLEDGSAFLYRGGFALTALVTAGLIAVSSDQDARVLHALLESRPLRWLGNRSYSLYLWHWPVMTVTRAGSDVPLDGIELLALRVGISVLLAEASYRFIEQPFRQGALDRSWVRVRRSRGAPALAHRATWLATSGAAFALAGAVATAPAAKPPAYLAQESVHLSFVAAGIGNEGDTQPIVSTVGNSAPEPPAVVGPEQGAEPAVTPEATPAAEPTTGPTPEAPAPPPAVTAAPAPPPPAPKPVPGNAVLAIGDSVMLGAAADLGGALGTVEIDAAVGRQSAAALATLRGYAANGLPGVVVIHIGNNGSLGAGQVDALMEHLGGVRRVVFVTIRVDRPWVEANNANIWAARDRYANIVIADWQATSAGHPEYFQGDGVHLRPEGAQAYADLIAAAAQ